MEYGSIALTGWLLIFIMYVIERHYPHNVQPLWFNNVWYVLNAIILVITLGSTIVWIWT